MKVVHIKYAFTLSEVLVALAVIGVLAIMTIPSLLAQYQQLQLNVQLKKVVSDMS